MFYFPTPVLALLIVGGSTGVALLATWLVRRSIPEDVHRANNEVAGFIFAVVGVVYAVLLAFIVLVVWQQYEDAQLTVEREANAIGNLYLVAQELPAPYNQQLETAILDYSRAIVNDEWLKMSRGERSVATSDASDAIWHIHADLHQANVNLGTTQSELFEALRNLTNERRVRLLAARDELPPLMWILLWGGAMITVAFSQFFRAPNALPHYLMVAMLTIVLAFVLFLILEIDIPFIGEISIHPTSISDAINLFQRIQTR